MDARTRRLVFLAAVTALALLGTGMDCDGDWPPDYIGAPSGPDSTWIGAPTAYNVVAAVRTRRIRYVMDWGDLVDTTDVSYPSAETVSVVHTWTTAGTVSIKVQAFNDAAPDKVSYWSPLKTVKVILNQSPVIDEVIAPTVAVKDVTAFFAVKAHDPDGDSVQIKVRWGDSKDTLTPLFVNPCSVDVNHIYTQLETLNMICWAIDQKGTESNPETTQVIVGSSGGVNWYLLGSGWTSALVANDGSEECVYCSIEEYPGDQPVLRAFGAAGGLKHRYAGVAALLEEPACCASTGHIIIGGDGGEFCALEMDLDEAWSWFETEWQRWGPMAVNGARIYLKTNYDEAYYFIDSVTSGVRIAEFRPAGHQTGAPVIDVQGDICFGTDSGYLYKMDPDFSAPIWRARLQGSGEIHGPIIGGDGTIYCTSDSFFLFAIDPANGAPRWKIVLDGEGLRPALGPSALFVGTSFGKVYSVDPMTGSINWQKQLGANAFETTPIVVTGGYVYFQNGSDVLYCVNQADGTVVWECDCKKYLPRAVVPRGERARGPWPPDYTPNPSILSNGNIIVVGTDALYCVVGYPERPLDPSAPWPKWQHDLHNTGHVGGGSR